MAHINYGLKKGLSIATVINLTYNRLASIATAKGIDCGMVMVYMVNYCKGDYCQTGSDTGKTARHMQRAVALLAKGSNRLTPNQYSYCMWAVSKHLTAYIGWALA